MKARKIHCTPTTSEKDYTNVAVGSVFYFDLPLNITNKEQVEVQIASLSPFMKEIRVIKTLCSIIPTSTKDLLRYY